MKRILLSAALVAAGLSANVASAQDGGQIGYGLKGGINVANLTKGDEIVSSNRRIGYHAGGYLKFGVTDWFFVQPEILYSAKGGKYRSNQQDSIAFGIPTEYAYTYTADLGYIDVPIVALFRVAKAITVHVGPQFSYLVNANFKQVRDNDPAKTEISIGNQDKFKKFDAAAVAGVGGEIGPVTLTLRYQYGLIPIAEPGRTFNTVLLRGDTQRNSVISLSAGFEL